MGLGLRESDEIRALKDINGDTYYLKKSAFGFGEEYLFYDKDGKEIERFSPSYSDYENVDGFYESEADDEVYFSGRIIEATFSFDEFYK